MGDGIMALFGAPVAHEDHAVRACYAALRMQESVSRYGDEIQRAGGVPVQIRVGLNSGEVVVRSIGSDLHMDYTAVGQTTHLAARMEQIAKAGSVLVTGETLKLVEGYVRVKPLGTVPVKGLETPIDVYEIVGAGPVRTRLQAAAARGLTRFVGRDAEIEALRQVLEKARAGHGQVVALVGEPGVGKSRLFWEFTHSHRTNGWLILESGSVSYGKATAYLPAIDLLKAYFQIEASDDQRKIREKLTGKLLTLDRTLEPTLPAFLALLDVPVEDAAWQALEPPQRRQRTLDSVKRLLLRESQVQPLCLVFEDLHWIDSETQALLDSLVESLPTARILLLVNYRPEYQHGWGGKTYYSQLRIDPLPQESADELLQALLGADPSLQLLKQLLIGRTEGNPFFLEESVRTLVETKVLAGERGAYRLAKALESIQVPATVQALLAARIDRLGPEEKSLLQTAAVIGKDVPFALLQAVAELPDEQLRRGLAQLQAAELLYEASLFPELEYTFKHALTQEVAYGSLLQERRRALHGRVVEAIERLYADRPAEQVERLAHHALRGELWAKAVTYFHQSGAKAMARSAHPEAVACFEQALAALGHLPEARETIEQAIDLRTELRNSLFPLGQHERIAHYLREAEALADTLGDQRRLGQIASYMANYYLAVRDHDRAIESGQRALAVALDLEDRSLQVAASFYLSQVYASMGDYGRAVEFNRRTITLLQGDPTRNRFEDSTVLGFSQTWLVWSLAELGDFAHGVASAEERLRTAEAEDQPLDLVLAYLGAGLVYLGKGELDRAISVLEHGLQSSQAANLGVWFPAIASPLGYAYALSGRTAEAIPLLEQAVGQTAATGRAGHALRIAHLSEAYLLAGRTPEATGLAERALELSRDRKERGHQAWVLRLLGEIAARQNPPDVDTAQNNYREAIALTQELGMQPLRAHCHLGLGALCGRIGRLEEARSALTTATQLFNSMEMTFWLSRAETELARTKSQSGGH
jgi:tetratricopeptide (TPR) repeat protein